jgi:hypothetical protein
MSKEKGPTIFGSPQIWIITAVCIAIILGTGAWFGLSAWAIGDLATVFGAAFVTIASSAMILVPLYAHYNQPTYEPEPRPRRIRDNDTDDVNRLG